MNDPTHETSMLEEVLDRDLTRADLDRLAEIAATLERDPGLAQRLDELNAVRDRLQSPADSAEPPAEDHADFTQRMVEAIERPAQPPATRRSKWTPWAPAVIGGAVAAVLMLAGVEAVKWLGDPPAAAPGPESVLVSDDPSRWLPAAPREQVAILTDLAGFYDDRAGWLATTGGDTQIGLTDAPIRGGRPLVTRLTLAAPTGELLTTDLALFPGQDVVVAVPRPGQAAVRYALRLTPESRAGGPARLAVTAQLETHTQLSASLPIRDAGVQEVGRVRTERGDYVLHLGLADTAIEGAI